MNRLALPVVAAQRLWLRSTLRLAPPAAGPTNGTVGTAARTPIRLAVIGESSAAGCGVDSHDDGFTGSLARELTARTHRPVQWQAVGQFGATARRIRHRLVDRVGDDLDVAVLLAGGNDVLSGRTPEEWRADLTAIVDHLMANAAHVVVAGTPPFARFPAIPATLGRYLSERATALDEVSRQVCAARPGATWVTLTDDPRPEFFAADRFHLSTVGYRYWATVIADSVRV